MKETIYDNVRVEVYPTLGWGVKNTPEEEFNSLNKNAKTLVKAIERHVDDIEDIAIEWDVKDICSFCKCEWEEELDGTPVCCNEAVKEFNLNKDE